MATKTTPTLFWSEDGRVGCEIPGHRPFPGGDTWRSERWRKMTAKDLIAFARESGQPVECETCRAAARNHQPEV